MAIPAGRYADGCALDPTPRAAVLDTICQLTTDLARDGFEALVTCDLDWLADIFARWTDPVTGAPARLPATADARWWPQASRTQETIAVLLRHDGVIYAATAQRLLHLHGSLTRALESGWFFYGRQAAAQRARGWQAEAKVPLADHIADCGLIYTCAFRTEFARLPQQAFRDRMSKGWQNPVSWRLARLGQALALAQWQWSWMMARGDEGMAMRYAPVAGGFTSFSRGLFVSPPPGDGASGGIERWQHLMFLRRGDLLEQAVLSEDYRNGRSVAAPMPLLDGSLPDGAGEGRDGGTW
jgi:hypothetical protein